VINNIKISDEGKLRAFGTPRENPPRPGKRLDSL